MMNDIQRRILAEAIKYGGSNISVPEQMAKMINESPVLTGGEAAPTLFGWGKHQFEAKFRELLTRMGFERGIIHMKTEGQEMKMYFANAAKARDFVVAFNGLARRKSMGSVASVATQFNKIKVPTGTNAIVSLDLTMIRGESLDIEGTDLYEWFTGDSITEEPLNEGGVKAALEDFMYSLPKAAIAEIKPLMTGKRGPVEHAMRLASITAILNKHGVAKKLMGYNTANLVSDYFNTFHGESVKEEVEVQEEYYSRAINEPQFIPAKHLYESFFKTLKDEKLPFDKGQAEKSLEYVFALSLNVKSNWSKYIKNQGDLIREAMTHYMKAMRVGGVIEQLSEQQQVIGKYRFTSFTEGSISGWLISVQGIGEVGFIQAPAKRNSKTTVAPHRVYKTKGQSEGDPKLVLTAYPDSGTRLVGGLVDNKEIRFAPRQLLKAVAMWMDKHGKTMTEEVEITESQDFLLELSADDPDIEKADRDLRERELSQIGQFIRSLPKNAIRELRKHCHVYGSSYSGEYTRPPNKLKAINSILKKYGIPQEVVLDPKFPRIKDRVDKLVYDHLDRVRPATFRVMGGAETMIRNDIANGAISMSGSNWQSVFDDGANQEHSGHFIVLTKNYKNKYSPRDTISVDWKTEEMLARELRRLPNAKMPEIKLGAKTTWSAPSVGGGGTPMGGGGEMTIIAIKEQVEMVSEYHRRGGYRSTSYSGDPRWITAKYAGRDSHGKPFKAGERVLYFPNGKKFYTGAEAEKAWLEFLSAKGDEEGMPFAR